MRQVCECAGFGDLGGVQGNVYCWAVGMYEMECLLPRFGPGVSTDSVSSSLLFCKKSVVTPRRARVSLYYIEELTSHMI